MTSPTPPIVYAVLAGDLALVKQRIASGAALDHIDPRKSTALNQALNRNHLDIAAVLLAAGADPMLADGEGRTPWMMTEEPEAHALLRRYGAVDPRKKYQREIDQQIDFADVQELFRTTPIFQILTSGRWGCIPAFIQELNARNLTADATKLASVWDAIIASFGEYYPPTDQEMTEWTKENLTPTWNLPMFRRQT